MNQPSNSRDVMLVLGGVGGALLLLGVGFGAYSMGRQRSSEEGTTTSALTRSLPAATPIATTPAAPPDDGGEEHMTASHGAEFPFPLDFHFARVRGRSVYDLHGQLSHNDGHYFELGPGDTGDRRNNAPRGRHPPRPPSRAVIPREGVCTPAG